MQSGTTKNGYSAEIERALRQDVLKRLPLTFLPFVNQQLHQWDVLFGNERRAVETLLLYVAGLSPEKARELFAPVIELENRMGVRQWKFSTSEQTIQNSSQLAASPYFQPWRQAVQAVFDTAESSAQAMPGDPKASGNRLVLIDLPHSLPLDSATVWRRWQGIGKPVQLDLSSANQAPFEFLLGGGASAQSGPTAGLLELAQSRGGASSDRWVIDAGLGLVASILSPSSRLGASSQAISNASQAQSILLSYARLDAYRQMFSHEMNTMRKDLADADQVFDRLRQVDVAPWCPEEIAGDLPVREFLRSLYLSGNGAVIFGNSFVEWAASEAFRRARPRFLAAQFGVRSKPKPFTGVAVFENPDQINPLPAVDDLQGSAVDAEMLALYVWLAASRYPEYQRATACVCVAESIEQAYVVAPAQFPLQPEAGPVSLERLRDALGNWMQAG